MEMPTFVYEVLPLRSANAGRSAPPAARRAAREPASTSPPLNRPRGRASGGRGKGTCTACCCGTCRPGRRSRAQLPDAQPSHAAEAVWLDAPVFYLTAQFNDNLVPFRSQLKAAGVKVSYNDLVVKACAKALRDVPAVNASWAEDAITRHGAVHVGMAVALPDGLITPVVRNADQKGLGTIATETRDLATRARDRKLAPDEYQGSTFTISNLGTMGIEQFTAIINLPEAVILAVGSMQRTAWWSMGPCR